MKLLILLFALASPLYIFSQNEIRFGEFNGNAIFMPVNEISLGHGKHVYDNRVIGQYSIDVLNIDRTNVDTRFPNINQKSQFGLLLRADLEVFENGCYEFELESDDGSILWIEKQLIIDNDSVHQMRSIVDTIWLDRGLYLSRIWYYNAFPEEYGLKLNQRKLINFIDCDRSISNLLNPKNLVQLIDTLPISSKFYFDTGEFTLTKQMELELNNLCISLNESYFSELVIDGFTDNIGSNEANLVLSKKRATSVYSYIAQNVELRTKKVSINGLGEVKSNLNGSSISTVEINRNVSIKVIR